MGAPLPLGNKKVTKLNNTNISPSFTETPSPKICHKKDNNFIINTSVDSLTSFDYYKYKMKILSEIQKMITILENGFNNNMSFTKSKIVYIVLIDILRNLILSVNIPKFMLRQNF